MISIIVPIYNVETYLSRCVDSILNQTITDIEVILVDDGSPDRCGEVCDQYEREDPRIRVIHKENGGLSDARNAGLEIAKGEYIAFVDSDDWLDLQYLEKLMNYLRETNADICECKVYRTSGESFNHQTVATTEEIYDTTHALEELIQNRVFHQHVWNKLYRRKVIGDVRFPLGKTNEDEFWTYHVFGQAKRAVKISDTLYNYFQRPNSIMGKNYSLKRLDALEAKMQRQQYLTHYFPELQTVAKINFYFSCVYAGQMSMKFLTPEELQIAKNQIDKYVNFCRLENDEPSKLIGGSKFWYQILKRDFWLGCKLRNLIGSGF